MDFFQSRLSELPEISTRSNVPGLFKEHRNRWVICRSKADGEMSISYTMLASVARMHPDTVKRMIANSSPLKGELLSMFFFSKPAAALT